MGYDLAAAAGSLIGWYRANARPLPWRNGADAYAVWVSEIMLQQTRVEAVKPYYARFMAELPTPADLAKAQEDVLLKLWEGLGYYSRVRNMQKAARIIMEQYDGQLPRSREALLTLPGIGDYTAGAIASIAYGLPEAAVDGNVLRVLARLDNNSGDVFSSAAKKAARIRVKAAIPAGEAGTFNQALMELGATVCLPNGAPLCGQCPLGEDCRGRAAGCQSKLPVKRKKKERRVEEMTVYVIGGDQGFVMRKRPDTGLLAGLWELPSRAGTQELSEALSQLGEWHILPAGPVAVGEATHIFTHVEWHMRVYGVTCSDGTAPKGWSYGRLQEDRALPTAFRTCLQAVGMEKGEA